jgi:hypothetical protein
VGEGEYDEPMAPQDSTIIFNKNSNLSNISTSIDLSKEIMRDKTFMKLGGFYVDLNQVKAVEDRILTRQVRIISKELICARKMVRRHKNIFILVL